MNLSSKEAVSGDARQLRRLNLERLLTLAMDQPGAFTRAELIRQTSLSAPTVGSLTGTLIHRGLLLDLGTGPSRGGRRPGLMEFNARFGVVLGIVLGVTETQMAVADLRGELLVERSQETPTRLEPAELLAWIADESKALLRKVDGPRSRLVAAAAGAPGAVDAREGRVVALAPNLRGWSGGVAMGGALRKHLGAPVLLDNDVNLAVLGERWRGAARGHDTCAFIVVGPGIGAGVMVEGILHRGHHFLAGEIALMCMGPEYVERDFGQRGCLETLANLPALESHWREASKDGKGSVFAAARHGDQAARAAVRDAATLLGIAATNLSLVLDPSLLVFGGPMLPDGEMLIEEVARIVRRIIPSPPKIVASELGDKATLWGSILVAATEARRRLRAELSAVPADANARPRSPRSREKSRTPRLASR